MELYSRFSGYGTREQPRGFKRSTWRVKSQSATFLSAGVKNVCRFQHFTPVSRLKSHKEAKGRM